MLPCMLPESVFKRTFFYLFAAARWYSQSGYQFGVSHTSTDPIGFPTKAGSLFYTDDWHAYTFLDIQENHVLDSVVVEIEGKRGNLIFKE